MTEPTTTTTTTTTALPPGWRIVHSPDAVSGAPPAGSCWAISEAGPATVPAWTEAETVERAWKLQARMDRMLEAMRARKAA